MPPCACDPSKDFFIIRFVDGSKEELSDEERAQTNQDEIDEFEENHTFNEPRSVGKLDLANKNGKVPDSVKF